MQIINGNLLDSDAQYIVHQCNCVTNRAAYLAAMIFKRYPYADIYSKRSNPYTPPREEELGNIIVCGNGEEQRYIIALLGQYYPGKPRYPDGKRDGYKTRELAFFIGLNKISQITTLESVAFPWNISCGAAGGNWDKYYEMLEHFDSYVNAEVLIYKYEPLVYNSK